MQIDINKLIEERSCKGLCDILHDVCGTDHDAYYIAHSEMRAFILSSKWFSGDDRYPLADDKLTGFSAYHRHINKWNVDTEYCQRRILCARVINKALRKYQDNKRDKRFRRTIAVIAAAIFIMSVVL